MDFWDIHTTDESYLIRLRHKARREGRKIGKTVYARHIRREIPQLGEEIWYVKQHAELDIDGVQHALLDI